MSELITLSGGASETIHGTYAGSITYIAMLYGDAADAWTALSADNRKRTLAAAVRYLNAQSWTAAYDTFAERDALTAFASAQYELAVMIAADPSVASTANQGSNISSVSAGGASVSYFNPTIDGADLLPPVLMRLIGAYLSGGASLTVIGGFGAAGAECNPFSADEDYDP